MNENQDFVELYLELANLIAQKVPSLRYIDLWHNQVNFLSEEHPFPTPALFFGFRLLSTQDQGTKIQKVKMQIDTYIYYETFADTYQGAINQDSSIEFLTLLRDTYASLHGTSGNSYSEMRRIGFQPVETGGAGNLYQQSYEATLMDSSAAKVFVDSTINDLEVARENIPPVEIQVNGFIIP